MRLYLELYKRLFEGKHKHLLITIGILSFFITLFSLVTPVLSKYMIDIIIVERDFKRILLICLITVSLLFVVSLMSILSNKLSLELSSEITKKVRMTLFEKMQLLKWNDLDKIGIGDLHYNLTIHSGIIGDGLTRLPFNYFFSILLFIIVDVVITIINFKISIFINIMVILNSILLLKLSKNIENSNEKLQKFAEKTHSSLFEYVNMIKLSQLHNFENNESKKMEKTLHKFMNVNIETNLYLTNITVLFKSVSYLWTIGILMIGAYYVLKNEITIGDLVALLTVTNILVSTSTSLINLSMFIPKLKVSLMKFNSIYSMNYNKLMQLEDTSQFENTHKLEIKNLSFKYNEADKNIIEKMNYTFERGNIYLIRGPSGCGKSTFLKIACGLIEASDGNVSINGCNILNLNKQQLREKISFVDLKTCTFNGSLLDNITYGIDNYSLDVIELMIQQFGLNELVDSLPDGIYSQIDNGVIEVSQGEKQIIALIRELLKKPEILLLDESLSNIDSKKLSIVFNELSVLNPDCIVIITSHRKEVEQFSNEIIDFLRGGI